MPQLSNRVNTFTDSVIRRMTRISDEYGAINLSQGFPDFDPPKAMLDALAKAAYAGPHQYSVTFGAENFREALAKKQGKAIGREIDPDKEIVVTCGGTEAMMCAMMTICNPGDKVMVFSPFYENYGADAILSGAEPIYIPLVPPEYGFDISLVEEGFKSGAKAIIVCNPSNPCGKVFTREELMQIGELAVKYDGFVVTDEVYEHMVYAPNRHVCMASLPGMYEHTITCNSLSKTYSITGWRLGYLIGPEEVIEGAKKVHDFLTVGAAAPLQEAAVTGLNFPESYYEELLALYTKKRAYFLKGLDEIGLKHNVPQGTYFVMIDIQEFLDLPQFQGWTDLEFCEWMIKNIGVAAVPGSSFFREEVNHLIRLHFAREEKTIDEALKRLKKLQELLNNGIFSKFANYTIGETAYEAVAEVCRPFGKRIFLIGGKLAMQAGKEKLESQIKGSELSIVREEVFGEECTYARMDELAEEAKASEADMIFGMGGGKALDTAKGTAEKAGLPVFTFPTIAATCAATTALSVVYREDGNFDSFYFFEKPARHSFIDTQIIAEAPEKYLRAGMGDTLGKYFECHFAARGDRLEHSSALGREISNMCYFPLLEYAEAALEECRHKKPEKPWSRLCLPIL